MHDIDLSLIDKNWTPLINNTPSELRKLKWLCYWVWHSGENYMPPGNLPISSVYTMQSRIGLFFSYVPSSTVVLRY